MIRGQRGVGMVEVLIALLLLALGVIGFTALQLQAVEVNRESLSRVQAMNLARDLAERMRVNPDGVRDKDGKTPYKTALGTNTSLASYTWDKCFNAKSCTPADMAIEDINQALYKANQLGMQLGLMTCKVAQGAAAADIKNGRQCIYVAWDKTTPTDGKAAAGANDTHCTFQGSYVVNSKCIVLEAF